MIVLTYKIGTAQDPVKTPRNPRQSDKVRTVDGSNGKYKAQHNVRKSNFVYNRLHIAIEKPRTKSKEKQKSFATTK